MDMLGTAMLTIILLPFVALFAGLGRGYLAALGWTVFTMVLSQVAAITGWGDWFPWSIPALYSGMVGPRSEQLGNHSYVIATLACTIGLIATFYWWRVADQTR